MVQAKATINEGDVGTNSQKAPGGHAAALRAFSRLTVKGPVLYQGKAIETIAKSPPIPANAAA